MARHGTHNTENDTGEQSRLAEARESYSGRLLTDQQFDEAIAITPHHRTGDQSFR